MLGKKNPVVDLLGRKIRLAMIGGGLGSFIGDIHRQAAIMDGRYEILAGIFSLDRKKNLESAKTYSVNEARCYENIYELIEKEKKLKDKIDAIAIMTPNDSHFEYASEALRNGFHVICDKPMTRTLAEAKNLKKIVEKSGLIFCLTHNYTGYPMVRQAKAMVKAGLLGRLRFIQVQYVQGGKAKEETIPSWRTDKNKAGASLVLGDIGTHAHNLMRFICETEVEEVSAEVGSIVNNRDFDDFAIANLHCKDNVRSSFFVTQAATAVENRLAISISGSKATIEWEQENPCKLVYKSEDSPMLVLTPNAANNFPLALRSVRIAKGHPEGFPEAFANIYSDSAEAIASAMSNTIADELSMHFPNVDDGLIGLKFIDAMLKSSKNHGKWTRV